MTFTVSKCVHNLPQTSILLGKLSNQKKKWWSPLHGASLTPCLIRYWTTHSESLFYTLVAPLAFAHPVKTPDQDVVSDALATGILCTALEALRGPTELCDALDMLDV
jgi:hypothetical protein